MKQKMAALFVALILTGSAFAVQSRGPANHADSAVWIKEHFECELDLAQHIRKLVMNLDEAIFAFLDYKNNKHNTTWHVERFDHYINELKCLMGQNSQEKTATILVDIQKSLEAMRNQINSFKGKKGAIEAAKLGNNLKPLIEAFDSHLPLSLTIEPKLKQTYGYTSVNVATYLGHLRQRLECK